MKGFDKEIWKPNADGFIKRVAGEENGNSYDRLIDETVKIFLDQSHYE